MLRAGIVLALTMALGSCSSVQPEPTAVETLIESGQRLFRSEGCINCHGDRGQGILGPSLKGILETFPDCATQIQWVSLGSAQWERNVGNSYGAVSKPVQGGMPGFGRRLTEKQTAEVVSYTRAVFGGMEGASAVAECGLSGSD